MHRARGHLQKFDGRFQHRVAHRQLAIYIPYQFGDLHLTNIRPITDATGTEPETLQNFFSPFRWEEYPVRDKLQRCVTSRHDHPHRVTILNGSSSVKDRAGLGNGLTACKVSVQRQRGP